MNRQLIALSLCAAFLQCGCQKVPPPPTIVYVTPPPTPEPTPIVKAATPEPEVPATPAPHPPPTPNFFAPAGVYFLVTRFSVQTDDSLVGLRPGTRVLQQPDGRYLADGHIVAIPTEQLTNDLRIAAQLTGADQAAPAAIHQPLATQTPPPRPMQQPATNPLSEIHRQRALINLQLSRIREQIRQLPDEPRNARMSSNAAIIQKQRDALEAQKKPLEWQLQQLKERETLIKLGSK